jgi:hypothetical protein
MVWRERLLPLDQVRRWAERGYPEATKPPEEDGWNPVDSMRQQVGADQVHVLLRPHGEIGFQPASDWSGDVPLPETLANFYREVGPMDLVIQTIGNPISFPRLSALWDAQAGYRWDATTGEPVSDWRASWFVIADEGGDVFIFDTESERILFALHGVGVWRPKEMFPDIFTMAACMGALGGLCREAGKRLYDADLCVLPEWINEAVKRVEALVGSRTAAKWLVEELGFV